MHKPAAEKVISRRDGELRIVRFDVRHLRKMSGGTDVDGRQIALEQLLRDDLGFNAGDDAVALPVL